MNTRRGALVRLELTLDEIELVSAAVCRDRERLLDDRFGYSGTRLISDREESLVPTHQAILRKIEEACTSASGRPLNDAIDTMIGSNQTSVAEELLGKVRALCESFSLDHLTAAIDVHRLGCHQSICPVLAVMVATAKAREEAPEVAKHPFGCGCDACEHHRAEHGS